MANLVITKGYADGAVLTKALLDTSFNDVSTWLNARDNASDSWLNILVTSTAAIPVSINSNASTTTLKINNTATDGDPKVSFQLSGSEKFALYVDDSDSDFFKIDNATGTCFQVRPDSSLGVVIADGSATIPGLALAGSTSKQTGIYKISGSDQIGFTTFGTGQIKITDGTIEGLADNDIDLGTTSSRIKNTYQYGMVLVDGVTAPSTITGHAVMYVDTSDGETINYGSRLPFCTSSNRSSRQLYC